MEADLRRTRRLNLGHRSFGVAETVQDQARTLTRQRQRDAESDTTGGARHESGLACQSHGLPLATMNPKDRSDD
jgi:hypothetical protein